MKQQGFTLSEIIVALGLLGVAILSVAALSFSTIAGSRKSSDTQTGTLLARQILETQIQSALNAPACAFWTTNSASAYTVQNVTVGNTPYHASTYITTMSIPPDPDLSGSLTRDVKRVEVVVNWWDSQTVAHKGYGKLESRCYRVLNVP